MSRSKKNPGSIVTLRIIGHGVRLNVVVWRTFKDLRAKHKRLCRGIGAKQGRNGREAAAFFAKPNEIHLCVKYIGVGVWAHELQHFARHLSHDRKMIVPLFFDEEAQPEIVEELTLAFWDAFFRCPSLRGLRPSRWDAITNGM